MSNIQLDASLRTDFGKSANRNLRHKGIIPAILYGAGQPPVALSLSHNVVNKAISKEEFFSQLITLTIDGNSEQVVLKNMQRHAYRPQILHIDFLRVKSTEKITMRIPFHFVGEASSPGVKQGGTVSRMLSDLEVRCLPADLPQHIEINLANMELNQILHLSDLKMPEGVEIPALTHGFDQAVVGVHIVKMAEIVEEKPVEAEAPAEVSGAPGAPGAPSAGTAAAAPASEKKSK